MWEFVWRCRCIDSMIDLFYFVLWLIVCLINWCIIYCVISTAMECQKKGNFVKLMKSCLKNVWKLSSKKLFMVLDFKFKPKGDLFKIVYENLFGGTGVWSQWLIFFICIVTDVFLLFVSLLKTTFTCIVYIWHDKKYVKMLTRTRKKK